MQPGEYIILKVSDIEDKIKHCGNAVKEFSELNSKEYAQYFAIAKAILETLLTTPTDLYEVVKHAFISAKSTDLNEYYKYKSPQDYLNNLEI